MQLNIPTLLTLFRIIIMPCFIYTYYLPFKWAPIICTLIFILAALTDWFDGLLARRWRQTTRFGAFLDPVADKVMITIALVLVTEYFHSWWITLPVVSIIVREIIISALREWMAKIRKHNKVAVTWISKTKTTFQMFAVVTLLWRPDDMVAGIGIAALYIAAVLTFWSMLQYFYVSRHDLFKN
ncbi:CDP-diacylglycerol--glycerol-3-phosphate 3-phosphatidyltransferase [Candidatus Curculioniphilus buchneri]|uniref:CDP-diacylglycerol--glycerol-3-phosphate 3-phosphatidyltransferase n=1 Tax=Candidatus Curculioniphilus buchneri TaxID=690594 RepID=UPI00376F1B17